LLTESDILALATRVQKSLKDDGASAGTCMNNITIIIATHVQTHILNLLLSPFSLNEIILIMFVLKWSMPLLL